MALKVFLYGKAEKPGVKDVASGLQAWFRGRKDVELVGCDLTLTKEMQGIKADLIVTLGGDGTLLWVARHMAANQIPVLGINLGKMGFLTELTPEEANDGIVAFAEGRYGVSSRLMLFGEIFRDGKRRDFRYALNDIVVGRESIGRLVPLEVYAGGRPVIAYRGDGLIVSTPTGSTGYNLSAAGPLIMAEIEAFVVTPICPHTLSSRPAVFGADERIEIRLGKDAGGCRFVADGQESISVTVDDTILVTKSPNRFKLVSVKDTNRFDVIREKLHWRSPSQ